MRASAIVAGILALMMVTTVIIFVLYVYFPEVLPPINGDPPEPPAKWYSVAVLCLHPHPNHPEGFGTPDETVRCAETGAWVTTTATCLCHSTPASAPKMQLQASRTYHITATTYGPFPPNGIASQKAVTISTPSSLSDNYMIKVSCIFGGEWPGSFDGFYYLVSTVELIPW